MHMFSRSNKGLLALPGDLQIAFFLAAILTSSMKLWFVLKFCSACFSLNGYKFVSQYLALEGHAVTWDLQMLAP